MPLSIQGMAPLIQVFDMPASISFYRDRLGFAITNTLPQLSDDPYDVTWAMLQLADVTLMLNTAYELGLRPAAPEPARFGSHSDTCLYIGCPDVDAAYQYLLDQGLDVEPPTIAPNKMKQIYLIDPDGYRLCFQRKA